MRTSLVWTVAGLALTATQVVGQLLADIYIPDVHSEEAIKPFLVNMAPEKAKQYRVLYGEQEDVHAAGEVHLLMTDALGVDREISIFAGLVRQIEDLMLRLQDPEAETVVLAPSNTAMQALSRKPWEDEEGAVRQSPTDEERHAMENIRKFVMSHVISSGRLEHPGEHLGCDQGFEIWYEEESDKRYVYSSKSEDVKAELLNYKSTGNGEVWTLSGVLN
ncbi:uncharacterized protein V1510DRAFT_415620 [Dipodascopsis tothii]|uniref:uncharacterized protein n=1 Tax=Dipodascopsis tothii TaxID=44089 RepID=UPI0034CDA26F